MRKTTVAILCAGFLASVQASDANAQRADELRSIRQDQYLALIYVVNECRFEPSTRLAAALLRAGIADEFAAALAQPRAPLPPIASTKCDTIARTTGALPYGTRDQRNDQVNAKLPG